MFRKTICKKKLTGGKICKIAYKNDPTLQFAKFARKDEKMPSISNKIVRMMSPGWPALALRSVDPFGSSSEMQIFKHKQITKMPAVSHFGDKYQKL